MCPDSAKASKAFTSLDEMLSTRAVGDILRRPVASVRRSAFTPAGWSSTNALFEGVCVDDETEPSLVAKTVEREKDWVAIATDDQVDREARTFEWGLLERLPEPAAHAVVAVARTKTSYSLLMRNLSPHLISREPGTVPALAQQLLVVDALAAVHAEFLMDDDLHDPDLGLSSFAAQISHGAPRTIDRIHARMGPSEVTEWIEEGWSKVPEHADQRIVRDLLAVAEAPATLVEAAGRYPWTLVHADPRLANIALDDSKRRVYLLDWARPTLAPPGYDLLYWLYAVDPGLVHPSHDLIEAYVGSLGRRLGPRFSRDWWESQLELCHVAFLAFFAPIIVQTQPDALPWWLERSLPGLRALG